MIIDLGFGGQPNIFVHGHLFLQKNNLQLFQRLSIQDRFHVLIGDAPNKLPQLLALSMVRVF